VSDLWELVQVQTGVLAQPFLVGTGLMQVCLLREEREQTFLAMRPRPLRS